MSSARWLVLMVLVGALSAGEDALPTPERFGGETNGLRVVLDLALPPLGDQTRARVLALLAERSLFGWPAGPTLEASLNAYAAATRADLAAARRDNPGAASLARWFSDAAVTTTWSGGNLLSLSLTQDGYLGGAHGMAMRGALVIDLATLRLLTLDDLIAPADQETFAEALTQAYRVQQKLQSDAILKDHGLSVDRLPAAMPLIVASGLDVCFEPYVVGPWSLGVVTVHLTRDQARPFLRLDPWNR
ncbi:MAG TPA: hypothetical protein VHX44_03250 [Planctomycetota bacterium]|nr:hypothetical protein [Planctomycetota bacterium]